ncbi:unnamed protein product [Didymodactylos carnosus]|uniref:HAT C-terminal dimerisation domain-containing protein n=1 Tax=Didymodactylos carnosus TaxID=1234261 RepID=A0A814H2R3_9BILA|nr:unnamed protein product [Didymodactylos carnosus]CAF3776310.1 unnamed protein product [Didymodactylos carnosus]
MFQASTAKSVVSSLQCYEIKHGSYSIMYTKHDNPISWWSMIRDEINGNSLKNIALQLFSIVPHAVMSERLFSMLDWQNTKRRNKLSPFTLEKTFMQTVDENQRILCELAGTDKIDEQNIEDKDLLDLTTMINRDDRELTKVLADESTPTEATDDDGHNDDYNIDDILRPLFITSI